MDLFEAIQKRRSIRRFKARQIPEDVIWKALEMAVLAPNSSNLQTWDFYWVRSDKKRILAEACLGQKAARSASELIVVTAQPKAWRRSWSKIRSFLEENDAHIQMKNYYRIVIPFVYRQRFFNLFMPLKKIVVDIFGFFKPVGRGPWTRRDLMEVSIKSAALAAENFVLAVTAQGYDTCMMEGFDEKRVRRIVGLPWGARVVMVIAVGQAEENEPTLPRFRLPLEEVVHEI